VSENVRVFTQENWDAEVLKSEGPVLVDFWAEWCAPCRAIAPSIESLAKTFDGRLKVGKLNVDDADEIAGRYGIRSIPTLLLFRGGKVVDQKVGGASLPDLTRFVESHASPAAVRT
jgi:thioredoxin 1